METLFNKARKYFSRVPLIAFLVLAFAAGFLLRGGPESGHEHRAAEQSSQVPARVSEWTCSMHPQIRQPKPGQCPICGMDLIPVASGGSGEGLGPGQIRVSAADRKLAKIQVAPAQRKRLPLELRLAGKVDYDETRRKVIAARVPGRLDRLFVDFTGVRVKQGDPLVYLYSPELYTAQEELLQALKAQSRFERSELSTISSTAGLTVEAAREKLRLLGLESRQVAEIEKQGAPSDHLTIVSPISGTVVHKEAAEGMYVSTGTRIYTVADLSHLWVQLEAYESDLPWLRPGQEVQFTTDSWPGETFGGRISFIDPTLDPATRTVHVRLEAPNPGRRLKPGMFVRAVVHARYEPGPESMEAAPLVIPASAPLITGTRAVVYVEVPGSEGVYEGREVVLGPRTGDYYVVRQGLEPGEMVVVNGNFKIDSAIQILAGPSMMNPAAGGPAPGHDHGPAKTAGPVEGAEAGHSGSAGIPGEFRGQLERVYRAYFEVQQQLSEDRPGEAREKVRSMQQALGAVDMGLLKGAAHQNWMVVRDSLLQGIAAMDAATDLAGLREGFSQLSEAVSTLLDRFGGSGDKPVILFHCPMAFENKGAVWFQDHPDTRNPYFGATMLKCQDRIDTVYAGSGPDKGGHAHE
ncbi:MAG: efflux RND transporter periplasmic adaptor subunit [Candidatus Glassbacteria bacterium]|nr:efflux RND transporter periplasmic adaptor subunit [Candidatus Glassbacteria bacterium]